MRAVRYAWRATRRPPKTLLPGSHVATLYRLKGLYSGYLGVYVSLIE